MTDYMMACNCRDSMRYCKKERHRFQCTCTTLWQYTVMMKGALAELFLTMCLSSVGSICNQLAWLAHSHACGDINLYPIAVLSSLQ